MEFLMTALIVICGIQFFVGIFLKWWTGREIVFPGWGFWLIIILSLLIKIGMTNKKNVLIRIMNEKIQSKNEENKKEELPNQDID